MPSAWVRRDVLRSGSTRYRVIFRLGGRESARRYGGSFRTMREARARRDWITGELAALRVPDLRALGRAKTAPTTRSLLEAWRESRRDVAAGTRQTYDVAITRIVSRLGSLPLNELDTAAVDRFVGELDTIGLARESIRKTLGVLAQALDWHGLEPNPARDRRAVKLPPRVHEHVSPPSAEHVDAVHRLLPPAYRLPLLVLDATGMRVGELEALTWGDVDEAHGRWRVTAAVAKTRKPRWVTVPDVLFEAALELCPRDDRHPDRRVFESFGSDRFRTAITRACTAAGVPTFSPHDLRHRRVSLLHAAGVPWARIGEAVGQRSIAVTADTYSHVLIDETELDYPSLLHG